MRTLSLLLGLVPLFGADYASEVAQKRQRFELELREKDSPLSLVARRTVKQGTTKAEARDLVTTAKFPEATVEWDGRTATLIGKTRQTLETRPDTNGIIRIDEPASAVALHWNGKTGELFLRFYDQGAPKGKLIPRAWYPADPRYRITAQWKPFPAPQTITVTRADGTKTDYPSPGMASFTLDGHAIEMRAIALPDGRIFLPFKDKTAPRETYGAGRFLYAETPKDGKVVLDFNVVNNPNCAFSPYWSCVLPLKENILSVRIPAGEKNWPGH